MLRLDALPSGTGKPMPQSLAGSESLLEPVAGKEWVDALESAPHASQTAPQDTGPVPQSAPSGETNEDLPRHDKAVAEPTPEDPAFSMSVSQSRDLVQQKLSAPSLGAFMSSTLQAPPYMGPPVEPVAAQRGATVDEAADLKRTVLDANKLAMPLLENGQTGQLSTGNSAAKPVLPPAPVQSQAPHVPISNLPKAQTVEARAKSEETAEPKVVNTSLPPVAKTAEAVRPAAAHHAIAPLQIAPPPSKAVPLQGVPSLIEDTPFELPFAPKSDGIPLAERPPSSATYPASGHGPAAAKAIAPQLVAALSQPNGTTTEIALNPEELGRVRISLSHAENGLTIAIASDRPETTDLMRRYAGDLAREFAALGYDNLNFSFEDSGQGTANDRSAPEGASHDVADADLVDLSPHISPLTTVRLSAGLDLKL